MNIYQHFRKDEQEFIDQVIDWVAQVENQYRPYLSNFLNPRQQFIVQSVVGQYEDIDFDNYGGNAKSEQARVLIYPPYFEPTVEDFDIALIEIDYPTKFAEISHGQIMGTVLGAGVSRDTLGDIVNEGDRWQFFIDLKMKEFIYMNVDRIGRTTVNLVEKDLEDQIEMTAKWKIEEVVVSSFRIDVVLARALNLSRNKAKALVNNNRIKINWIEIEQPDIDVERHDIISIRGHGRVQIREQLGKTRKDNIVLKIGKIDRNT